MFVLLQIGLRRSPIRQARPAGTEAGDFSLNLYDTAYWRNDLRVIQKTENIIIFQTPFGADYGYSITFKKGIGITNSILNGFAYYRRTLIKAEIK